MEAKTKHTQIGWLGDLAGVSQKTVSVTVQRRQRERDRRKIAEGVNDDGQAAARASWPAKNKERSPAELVAHASPRSIVDVFLPLTVSTITVMKPASEGLVDRRLRPRPIGLSPRLEEVMLCLKKKKKKGRGRGVGRVVCGLQTLAKEHRHQ